MKSKLLLALFTTLTLSACTETVRYVDSNTGAVILTPEPVVEKVDSWIANNTTRLCLDGVQYWYQDAGNRAALTPVIKLVGDNNELRGVPCEKL